jgi:hypothetical protein
MKTSVLPLSSASAITDAGTLLIALCAVRNPVGTVAGSTCWWAATATPVPQTATTPTISATRLRLTARSASPP